MILLGSLDTKTTKNKPYLGDYVNLAEIAIVDSTYANIHDQTLSTSYLFPDSNPIEITITFSTPPSGEDSYGIDKVILYCEDNAICNGWLVYYRAVPRGNDEWPCDADENNAAIPSATTSSEETDATVQCGVNVQTKTIILRHSDLNGEKLLEVVIGGDQSSRFPCDVGWIAGTQPCSRCAEGDKGVTVTDETDTVLAVCEACDEGTYSSYLNAYDPIQTCSDCSPGKYSGARASFCTECAPGTFQDVSKSSECKPCTIGHFQANWGQISCDDKCGPGSYSGAGAATCERCSTGYYSTEGVGECTECSVGMYQGDEGQGSCISCPVGTVSPTIGASACTPCAAGTFADTPNQTDCQSCPAGQYQDKTGQSACLDCNVGSYSETDESTTCVPCPVGYYVNAKAALACLQCPSGTFQDESGWTTCKSCITLTYQGQLGQSTCIACDTGKFSEAEASSCEFCDPGLFLNEITKTCEVCPKGSYAVQGSTSCTSCPIMQYQPEHSRTECLECPLGEYTHDKGSIACLKCDVGTYRSGTSQPECDLCPMGEYSDTSGTETCSKCPKGHYTDAAGMIRCSPCEGSTYQGQEGQAACLLCPKGHYNDMEGMTECTPCPIDTFTSTEGSFSCQPCQTSYYAPTEGSEECLVCPKRAAYQPPTCPPVIPNCPAVSLTNVYGNFAWPEREPLDEGDTTGTPVRHTVECSYALYVDDLQVLGDVTRECQALFVNDEQTSFWTTASFKPCGTAKTEALHDETKLASELMEQAREAGISPHEVTVEPALAQDMLDGLFDIILVPDDNTVDGSTDEDEEAAHITVSLGAADTKAVVATLSVISNSVPPEVLADVDTRNTFLSVIDRLASQDENFVADTGADTASACVNIATYIAQSVLAITAVDPDNTDGDDTTTTKPKVMKTNTMTIVPTLLTEETKNEPFNIDMGQGDQVSDPTESEGSAEYDEGAADTPVTEGPNNVELNPIEDGEEDVMILAIVTYLKPAPIKKTVTITMPPLKNIVGDNPDSEGVVAIMFNSAVLFPMNKTLQKSLANESDSDPVIASNVILLSVGPNTVIDIDPPIEMTFTVDQVMQGDTGDGKRPRYQCAYYRPDTYTWSTDGCTTLIVEDIVFCKCSHMTSFAILMSMEPIPDYLADIQSSITNPLLAISLIFLLVMIGTILPITVLRSTRSMKIHLSLAGTQCFAIIIFLLTNLTVINVKAPLLCKTIALLMDYSYLVVFMWTVVESVIMYISLVQVFGGHISYYMLKFNLFCWLTPLLSLLTDYFLTEGTLLETGKCVVKLSIRKWSFILPIGVILIINFTIFCALLKVIAKAKNPDKSNTHNAMKQLKAVASISCLLGLGWIISFFGHGPVAPYIQFAFIFINGTQGVLMFLFYCIGNEQYMDIWRKKLGLSPAKKPTNSSTSTMGTSAGKTAVTVAKVTPATAGPSQSTAAKPKNTSRASNAAAAPRTTKRSVKDGEEDPNLLYVNENVYDIIDDPENFTATITRI